MVRKLNSEVLEQYDKPQREMYWRRQRKAKIDFFDESPFAIDRQLEDQKQQMRFNRNPQLSATMKADVPRSNKMFESKDTEDSSAIKAKVVNKIVRQASGINAYALVPPPRAQEKKSVPEEIDPDTHPRLKAYAKEATSKPVICSFGHRPRSASRTFHPATMRVRLRHGEVIKNEGGKTGFGLSVAVLSKLLYAPKLYPSSSVEDEDAITSLFGAVRGNDISPKSSEKIQPSPAAFDPSELFSLPDGSMDSGAIKSKSRPPLDVDNGSVPKVSKTAKSKKVVVVASASEDDPTRPERIGKISLAPLSVTGGIDRPLWKEGFHTIDHPAKEKYVLRQSVITEGSQDMSLNKRLQRFASLTVAEKQLMPTCQDRQLNDLFEMTGERVRVKKSKPVKGQVLYYDPLDEQLEDVKSYRELLVQQRENRIRAKLYQDALTTIPDVPYNAISVVQQARKDLDSDSTGSLGAQQSLMPVQSRSVRSHVSNGHTLNDKARFSAAPEDVQRAVNEGLSAESYHAALLKAKKGDTAALYQHFIGVERHTRLVDNRQSDAKTPSASVENDDTTSSPKSINGTVLDAEDSGLSPAEMVIASINTASRLKSDVVSVNSGRKSSVKQPSSQSTSRRRLVVEEPDAEDFDDDIIHGYKNDSFFRDYNAALLDSAGDDEEGEGES